MRCVIDYFHSKIGSFQVQLIVVSLEQCGTKSFTMSWCFQSDSLLSHHSKNSLVMLL